ncbi:hypothetical protein C1752_10589 [Acaryochloris thomasi RCC1774]|uniref:Uncharacterized protein n=1 Tax=Acaryochloris thomasi RCC1774 TaxID=1764569 RepID=A0A2W1JHG4_9CYAN|nr:hypothetical protein [Acaryochloris thomasi]PZD70582.1 hypothetical protein C1752_10589 [Acaryochloris thomasi RCC1774]
MFKQYAPLALLGAATTAVVLPSLPAQAAQRFTVSQAAEKAKVNLNPNEGVYIQLPPSMPISSYSIDDGSVLTLGGKFSPGTNILRIVGKNPGKTGLGLVVQGGSGYQTLNLAVRVGNKGSQGTIEITEDSLPQGDTPAPQARNAAQSKLSYPSDLVRSGLSLANIQGQIPAGSPLDMAVNQWIDAVEQGVNETDASRRSGVQSNVLQRLTELGQTTPVVQSPPPESSPTAILPSNPPSLPEAAKNEEISDAVASRIAALEKQVETNTNVLSKQKKILAQVESQQQTFLARFDAIDSQSEQFLAQLSDIKAADSKPEESATAQAVQVLPSSEADSEPVAEAEPQADEQSVVVAKEAAEQPPEETEAETKAASVPVMNEPEEQLPEASNDSLEEMNSIELAHAIKQGLHQNSKDYPYSSWKYRQVNNAVLILKRGNSIETASKWSGLELETLLQLANETPMQVSQGVSQ